MTLAIAAANQLATEGSTFVQNLLPFRGPLGSAFRTFTVAHFYLSCYENYDLIKKHPTGVATGAFLKITCGEQELVRKGAQLVLIIQAIKRCNQAKDAILSKCSDMSALWNETYPHPIGFLQQKGVIDYTLKESRPHFITDLSIYPHSVIRFFLKLQIIVKITYVILQESFTLSRQCVKFFEALTFDKWTEMTAFLGLVTTIEEFIDNLSANPKELAQTIEKDKETVDRFLQMRGVECTYETICHLLQKVTPVLKISKVVIQETLSTAKDAALLTQFVTTGLAATSLAADQQTMQPAFIIGNFNDNTPCTLETRKARHWDLRERFYVPHQP
ncbi:MAG: hypothetical protein JWO53_789 [Chlamydiia bacterium]|nr:hypothetical protein [Chlamydiia bacterium]